MEEITDKLFERGKSLGKSGDGLQEYVSEQIEIYEKKEQEKYDREERAAERENKARMRDIEEDERKRSHEAEESDKQRHHEVEMLKYKIQLEEGKKSTTDVNSAAPQVKGPKLPYFDETKDDMDAFIRRFERYALANKWEPVNHATYLSALLRGKALEVYSRMASTDINDYNKLKSALLRQYQMTEEGFRKKFHGVRMERDESSSQFVAKLCDVFDRWVQLAEVEGTYEKLR